MSVAFAGTGSASAGLGKRTASAARRRRDRYSWLELVERAVADPREPNILYLGWRGDHDGRALAWWVAQLQQPRLAAARGHGRPFAG